MKRKINTDFVYPPIPYTREWEGSQAQRGVAC